MFRTVLSLSALASLFALSTIGCSGKPAAPPATPPAAGGHSEHGHGEHGHAEHGPHQGDLIELGQEEYHAELVHDEHADKVIIYLLGADAKTPQPIAETELKLNFSVDGAAKQFSLQAAPLEGEPQGQSSRFESGEEALHEVLDKGKVDGRLNVTIGGKPYVGAVHGHEHAHGPEAK